MPLADMQFLQQREFSTREVARIFRVRPGSSAAAPPTASLRDRGGAGARVRRLQLRPILTQIEQAISADGDLCPGPTLFAEFVLDELLRGDPEQRSTVYETRVA
jgi:phage portal protein BeeE